MRRLLLTFILIVLAVATPVAAGAAAPMAWEEVTAPQRTVVQTIDLEAPMDVQVADGYIYIHTQKGVTVRLFSILGQQIHQQTLTPGLHRLRVAAKGIYILRAGSTTKRITL